MKTFASISLIASLLGVSVNADAEGEPPKPTGFIGKCDFTYDCDNDSDCTPGLLCADDHKQALQDAGYDQRTADCVIPETANKYWEVCFDSKLLYPPSGGGFGGKISVWRMLR
jgi:hypothetical protein